LLTVK
jgi:hypothetical protein